MATTAQINYLTSLATQAFAGNPGELMNQVFDLADLNNAAVTKRINFLKGVIKGLPKAAPKPLDPKVAALVEGYYLAGGMEVKLVISKKTGKPYLYGPSGYIAGGSAEGAALLAEIAEDPKGAAIAYGKATGSCGICGKTLTKQESIDAGIGPWCAGKF